MYPPRVTLLRYIIYGLLLLPLELYAPASAYAKGFKIQPKKPPIPLHRVWAAMCNSIAELVFLGIPYTCGE